MIDSELIDDDDSAPRFNVTIQLRAKHADLLRAARKMGSARKLAEHLGISIMTMSNWITLKRVPNLNTLNSNIFDTPEKRDIIEQKLFDLTGKTMIELWPDCIRSSDFLDLPKTTEFDVNADVRGLAIQQEHLLCLPSPSHGVETSEVHDAVIESLTSLPEKYAKVLAARYGLDGAPTKTLSELAKEMGVSRSRIGQMEDTALRMLRENSSEDPNLARLKDIAEESHDHA